MNRREKELLRTTISGVIRRNSVAWSELKLQISDGGFQPCYPVQGDFDEPAERAIAALPPETKTELIGEWRSAVPTRTVYTDAEILAAYGRIVVEQIVTRARTAAYKTTNW